MAWELVSDLEVDSRNSPASPFGLCRENWLAKAKLGAINSKTGGCRPASFYNYAVAVFASRCAPSEDWWRWLDSNQRLYGYEPYALTD